MNSADERTRLLQQIPVFALRQLLNETFEGEEGENTLKARLNAVLNRKPRLLRKAVLRLTRLELTQLINACPEIADASLIDLFERYRYGSHPSFHIYLFDPKLLKTTEPSAIAEGITRILAKENEEMVSETQEGLPRIRDITLNDFSKLPGAPEIFEGTYRFLSRLDYVDAEQNAVSTYETLYGFFWINTSDGYVTIHARKPEVLSSIKQAIEQAGGIYLTALVISKQFKNALRFLERDYFRSSRLYEPDPNAKRFQRITISDRRAYEKDYEKWENAYPEVRSTRYRVQVGDKETTLTLRCDQGALSLAGRLQASEFRDWAIVSLREVIRVLNGLRASPAEYVQTHRLRTAAEMLRYTVAQRVAILHLISLILTLKQEGGEHLQLEASPIELAITLRGLLRVQINASCTEPDCDEESLITCPVCGGGLFSLKRRDDALQLDCAAVRRPHWSRTLPFTVELECGHEFLLDDDTLERQLELLPSAELLSVMARLANQYLADYSFDAAKEGFFIRGSKLTYYPDKDLIPQIFPEGAKIVFNTHVEVENVYGGEVTGVKVKG
jgi:hypothetical protein